MAPKPTAQRIHDELFPDEPTNLMITDPELTEVLYNFAFGEVLEGSRLETPTRLMIQLSAMIASQTLSQFRLMAGAALTAGLTPVALKEVVYQAVPYLGWARVYDFLHATNDLLTQRGVKLPLEPQSTTTPETRLEEGLAVQRQIVGEKVVEQIYAAAPPDEKHIQRFLSDNCFGDYLTRGGIDVPTRELLTFSMLVALGGAEGQVKAHVSANLLVGNDRAMLIDLLTQLIPYIGYPRTLNGLRAVDEVVPNKDGA